MRALVGANAILRAEKILAHLVLLDERITAAAALKDHQARLSEENKAIGSLQYWADEARALLGLPMDERRESRLP